MEGWQKKKKLFLVHAKTNAGTFSLKALARAHIQKNIFCRAARSVQSKKCPSVPPIEMFNC